VQEQWVRLVLFATASVLLSSQVARSAEGLADCRAMKDDKERLACFDRVPNPVAPAPNTSPAVAPPPAGGSKPIPIDKLAAASFPDATLVDAADLGVGSKKYVGKSIELRDMKCYYADVSDYRCISGRNVVVFTAAMFPDVLRLKLEKDCGELKKMTISSVCSKSIRFRFSEDEVDEDMISGYQRRTIIRPEAVELVAPPPQPQRRRNR